MLTLAIFAKQKLFVKKKHGLIFFQTITLLVLQDLINAGEVI